MTIGANDTAGVGCRRTAIERIFRYQATINRQLFQAMNQIERLQRPRKGENVPAPAAATPMIGLRTPKEVHPIRPIPPSGLPGQPDQGSDEPANVSW